MEAERSTSFVLELVTVMVEKHSSYISYLLRLWLENEASHRQRASDTHVWRASLEEPGTQEMQIFDNLDALFDFLTRQAEGLGLNDTNFST